MVTSHSVTVEETEAKAMRKQWPARTGEGGTFLSVTGSFAAPQHLHYQSLPLCLLPTVPTALNHFRWGLAPPSKSIIQMGEKS